MSEKIRKSDIFDGDPFADIKKTVEDSLSSMGKYDEHLKSLAASYLEISKSVKNSTEGLTKLIEVEKAANTVKKETKKNNDEITAIEKERQRLTKAEEVLKARLANLSSEEAKNVAKLRAEITEQNKQLKQSLQAKRELTAEEQRNLGTLEKLAIANNKLRAERQKLNLETQKGRERLVEINKELDKNNAFIKNNSDALSAQKMNVGNYSDSVKDALNQSGLFSRQLSQLNRINKTLTAILKKNTDATTAQAAANNVVSKTTGGVTKSLRVLRAALIATGIGAIVVLIGSLISYLTTAQQGMDEVNDVLAPLIGGFKSFLGVLQDLGGGVFQMAIGWYKILFNTIALGAQRVQQGFLKMRIAWNDFFGDTKEANELRDRLKEVEVSIKESTDALTKGAEQIKIGWDKSAKAISGANEKLREGAILQQKINNLTRRKERNEIASTLPIAKNNLLFREQQEIINDTSKSEKERNAAILVARKAIKDNMQREMQIEADKLRLLRLEAKFNDTNRTKQLEIEQQKAAIIDKQADFQRKLNTLAAAQGTITNQVNKQYQERLKIINETADIEQQIAIERERRRFTELEREGVHFSELLEQRRKIALMDIKIEQDRFERLRKISKWSKEEELLEQSKLNKKLIDLGWEFEDDQRQIFENRVKPVKTSNSEIIAEEFEALERLSEQRKLMNLNNIKDDEDFKTAELKRELDLIDAKIEALKKLEGVEDEIRSLRIQRAEMERKTVEKLEVQTVNVIINAQNQLAQVYENASRRKIEALRAEQQAIQENLKANEEAAKEGTILDEESIKQQKKQQKEAIKEQQRLEKQQQRVQFIQLALQNVANQMKAGKSTGEALTSTVALQSALKALFSGFQGFFKGTDNAPQGFAWVDEKGAEIHTDKHGNIKDLGSDGGARLKFLEKGDKIIPHYESMKILNPNLPSVKPKSKSISDPTIELLREQNRLLKNVTESKMTAEKIGSILHLTTEDKKGNHSRINRYKYKK